MKRSIYLAVGILFSALFYSCELLPDLNPNTSEGADILILHPNDVLISARPSGSNAIFFINDYSYQISNMPGDNYNFIDIGENCLYFICACPYVEYNIRATGGVLGKLGLDGASFGSVVPYMLNNLASTTPLGAAFYEGSASPRIASSCNTGRDASEFFIPNGIKYVMFKHLINGSPHYGWIEFETNLNFNNITGQCIIKRIALAQQPGLCFESGQTE
jgi:hypothetical protein